MGKKIKRIGEMLSPLDAAVIYSVQPSIFIPWALEYLLKRYSGLPDEVQSALLGPVLTGGVVLSIGKQVYHERNSKFADRDWLKYLYHALFVFANLVYVRGLDKHDPLLRARGHFIYAIAYALWGADSLVELRAAKVQKVPPLGAEQTAQRGKDKVNFPASSEEATAFFPVSADDQGFAEALLPASDRSAGHQGVIDAYSLPPGHSPDTIEWSVNRPVALICLFNFLGSVLAVAVMGMSALEGAGVQLFEDRTKGILAMSAAVGFLPSAYISACKFFMPIFCSAARLFSCSRPFSCSGRGVESPKAGADKAGVADGGSLDDAREYSLQA